MVTLIQQNSVRFNKVTVRRFMVRVHREAGATAGELRVPQHPLTEDDGSSPLPTTLQ